MHLSIFWNGRNNLPAEVAVQILRMRDAYITRNCVGCAGELQLGSSAYSRALFQTSWLALEIYIRNTDCISDTYAQ